MIASFFSSATTGTVIMAVILLLTFGNIFSVDLNSPNIATILVWSIHPVAALSFIFLIIVKYELRAEGILWSNLFVPATSEAKITVGLLMIMMLIYGLLFLLICLYVEQIAPGQFGIAKKWYFPCTSKFWNKKHNFRKGMYSDKDIGKTNERVFDSEPLDKIMRVQLKHLEKQFGSYGAVKDVSLNLYEDEITVLLGHNGAGKTTTICMLTGMYAPTSGTALINGYDIYSQTSQARSSMGICTQHNILFDEITVENHIKFYCCLRGLKGDELKEEIDKYLKLIGLQHKAKYDAKRLSGGEKRKLSVCCALCGDDKVVLCDEPSTGMDPAARQQMWQILQSEKKGRTILLTTHYMDEADVLSDRIAIMCNGEIKCYGTSFALKKQYGSGYKLVSLIILQNDPH